MKKLVIICLIFLSACSNDGIVHCVNYDEHFYTNIDFNYHNQYVLDETETIKIIDLELSKEELEAINKSYKVNYVDDTYILKRYIDYRDYDLKALKAEKRIERFLEKGQLNIFKTVENYQKAGFVCKY